MIRVCLDLNVWVGAFLAERLSRTDTAAQVLVEAVRSGLSGRGPVALVISWGMIFRLNTVLLRMTGDPVVADRLTSMIATYAREGPSLTLGGGGVLPLDDEEDGHVLETAFAGGADLMVTHSLQDFLGGDVEPLVPGHWYGASHGAKKLLIAHTCQAPRWLRGEPPPPQVEAFMASKGTSPG